MPGYYRSPTLHRDTLVFCSEDDLWQVPVTGGVARRLTASLGALATPHFSPDGQWIAFSGREEGAWEVYIMPATGGTAVRLTYQGATAQVAGWTPDGKSIRYSSEASAPFARARQLWEVPRAGGQPILLPWGLASHLSHGPGKALVLGRNTGDPARWKRYRGGTAGQLWVDEKGAGRFSRIAPAEGNVTTPMWLGKRIYFLSDHEGVGNLYSCLPSGKDLKRHTHHEDFYARGAATDGERIVYHAGGDCHLFDPRTGKSSTITIEIQSPRVQRSRRFVAAEKYLQGCQLRPDGKAVAITARGKLFSMSNWEGPVLPLAQETAARVRLATWLNDGKRIVYVSDSTGEELLAITDATGAQPVRLLKKIEIGHAMSLAVSPKADMVAIQNHRFELILADLAKGTGKVIDKSEFGPINGLAWSPDGQWLAYSFAGTSRTRIIKLHHLATGKHYPVTHAEFYDMAPAWDPEGKYLYFMSYRAYNPVYDSLHFDLGFPKAMQLMLVPLQASLTNPFTPRAEEQAAPAKEEEKKDGKDKKNAKPEPLKVETAGLPGRVVAFPRAAGRFGGIAGIKGKVLYTEYPSEPAGSAPDANKATLNAFDFASLKEDTLTSGVDGFSLSRDGATLIYRSGRKLRVLKAGDKPNDTKATGMIRDGGRAAGWLDLDRVKVAVDPPAEWRQMYREAWRLQREYFWDAEMSGVDWKRVYTRYEPLLDRISCRSELSDLLWEMQGELGTSHAYEMGGDYRMAPHMPQGKLGTDVQWDAKKNGYRLASIVAGDCWDEDSHSPLLAPGTGIAEGDTLLAINGVALTPTFTPSHALVNQAGQEVSLTVQGKKGPKRNVVVRTLRGEANLRYRAWVNHNRDEVHRRSKGQVGYVHIPDMGARGYAEFHRGWLPELHYPALIIDVRFNGGGHVSQLLLEKLARKRLGYDVPRWHAPEAYPRESVMGPMVALTNEYAGSDGDIFSHCFKRMNLGPLIGTRTWGGVIGISPRMELVDGSVTTQPEFSFWFDDVEWGVENYGTDPDVEVFITPQDYKAGKDPQLETGLETILRLLKSNPPVLPPFHKRPARNLPKLEKIE
jgi:tricorn protease